MVGARAPLSMQAFGSPGKHWGWGGSAGWPEAEKNFLSQNGPKTSKKWFWTIFTPKKISDPLWHLVKFWPAPGPTVTFSLRAGDLEKIRPPGNLTMGRTGQKLHPVCIYCSEAHDVGPSPKLCPSVFQCPSHWEIFFFLCTLNGGSTRALKHASLWKPW